MDTRNLADLVRFVSEYNAVRDSFLSNHKKANELLLAVRKMDDERQNRINELRTLISQMNLQAATLRTLQGEIYGAFTLAEYGFKRIQSEDYFADWVENTSRAFSTYVQQNSF